MQSQNIGLSDLPCELYIDTRYFNQGGLYVQDFDIIML